MLGVGVVAAAHHQDRHVQPVEPVQAVEGRRARHLAQRLGHGLGVLVALGALADRGARALAHPLGQVVDAGQLDEGVDVARAAMASARASQLSSEDDPVRACAVVGGGDLHQRVHPAGVVEGERHGRGRAHRAAREHAPVDAQFVQHALEVGHQLGVAVEVVGGGGGLAVAAGVVAHHEPAARTGEHA